MDRDTSTTFLPRPGPRLAFGEDFRPGPRIWSYIRANDGSGAPITPAFSRPVPSHRPTGERIVPFRSGSGSGPARYFCQCLWGAVTFIRDLANESATLSRITAFIRSFRIPRRIGHPHPGSRGYT